MENQYQTEWALCSETDTLIHLYAVFNAVKYVYQQLCYICMTMCDGRTMYAASTCSKATINGRTTNDDANKCM